MSGMLLGNQEHLHWSDPEGDFPKQRSLEQSKKKGKQGQRAAGLRDAFEAG